MIKLKLFLFIYLSIFSQGFTPINKFYENNLKLFEKSIHLEQKHNNLVDSLNSYYFFLKKFGIKQLYIKTEISFSDSFIESIDEKYSYSDKYLNYMKNFKTNFYYYNDSTFITEYPVKIFAGRVEIDPSLIKAVLNFIVEHVEHAIYDTFYRRYIDIIIDDFEFIDHSNIFGKKLFEIKGRFRKNQSWHHSYFYDQSKKVIKYRGLFGDMVSEFETYNNLYYSKTSILNGKNGDSKTVQYFYDYLGLIKIPKLLVFTFNTKNLHYKAKVNLLEINVK